MSTPEIRPARGDAEIAEVRRLFRDYAASLDFSLDFQGFDQELAGLPAPYSGAGGEVWLAWLDGQAVGVIAVKPLPVEGDCEMKRLYVAPSARGFSLGRRLAEAAIAFARTAGYRWMRLDTINNAHFAPAIRLYQSMGFVPCDDYNGNPIPGVIFLARDLTKQ